jgi:rod shape-determining protein MreD
MLHHHDKLLTLCIVGISLVVAMAFRIVPLPHPLAAYNPDWVLLFLIYWTLTVPEHIGVGTFWLTGLLTDALTARALGQHALAYSLVAYLCLRLHQRFRLYPLVQQSLSVGLLLLLSQFIIFWTRDIENSQVLEARYWLLPTLTGMLAWPTVLYSLRQFGPPSD